MFRQQSPIYLPTYVPEAARMITCGEIIAITKFYLHDATTDVWRYVCCCRILYQPYIKDGRWLRVRLSDESPIVDQIIDIEEEWYHHLSTADHCNRVTLRADFRKSLLLHACCLLLSVLSAWFCSHGNISSTYYVQLLIHICFIAPVTLWSIPKFLEANWPKTLWSNVFNMLRLIC